MSFNEILSRLAVKGATTTGNDASYKDFVPKLNSAGQLDKSLFSNVVRTNIYTAASETEQRNLAQAQDGDFCLRTDLVPQQLYALNNPGDVLSDGSAPATNMANWVNVGSVITTAGHVPFTAGSGLSSTNVQSAIVEVQNNALHINTTTTLTGVLTFDPADPAVAPFNIGQTNQGVLVLGLNADSVDGYHAQALLSRANHTGVISASSISAGMGNFDLTGNVTGNVTGDVTGSISIPSFRQATMADAPTTGTGIANRNYVLDQIFSGMNSILSEAASPGLTIAGTGAQGASTRAARQDHTHTMPDLASSSVPGFQSATDKGRFDVWSGGGFDNSVYSLLIHQNSVYAAGDFTKYGNVNSQGLARLDFSGKISADFNYTATSLPETRYLAPHSAGVYVASPAVDGGLLKIKLVSSKGVTSTGYNPVYSDTGTDTITSIATVGDDKLAVTLTESLKVYNKGGNSHDTYSSASRLNGSASSANLAQREQLVLASHAYSAAGVAHQFNSVVDPKGLRLLDFRLNSVDKFVVIGDYGYAQHTPFDAANALAIAEIAGRIKTAFPVPDLVRIITLGDNSYDNADTKTILDDNVGKYFQEYIGSYKGAYGAGAAVNKFFPTVGNHDSGNKKENEEAILNPYLDFFNVKSYYSHVEGKAEFFHLNSDKHEKDGYTAGSTQGQWLKNALLASTAIWKIVVFHHSPYTSEITYHREGSNSNTTWMRWPFKLWGASLVLSGHAHVFERLQVDGLTYIVNGIGGAELRGFGTSSVELALSPIAVAGTGYSVNNIITVVGGTPNITETFVSHASELSTVNTITFAGTLSSNIIVGNHITGGSITATTTITAISNSAVTFSPVLSVAPAANVTFTVYSFVATFKVTEITSGGVVSKIVAENNGGNYITLPTLWEETLPTPSSVVTTVNSGSGAGLKLNLAQKAGGVVLSSVPAITVTSKYKSSSYGYLVLEIEAHQLVGKLYDSSGDLKHAATFYLTNAQIALQGELASIFRYNAGSGAEASVSNPIISPDGKFIIAGNTIGAGPESDSPSRDWDTTAGNLLLNSENFTSSSWTKHGSFFSALENTGTSPWGTQTADQLVDSGDLELSYVQQVFTPEQPGPSSYEYSIFVKKDQDETRFPLFSLQLNKTTSIRSVVVSDIANAGSNYSLYNIITVVGGTGTAAKFQVVGITASGGVTTLQAYSTPGNYTVLPPTSATTSGGAGTGLTLTLSPKTTAVVSAILNTKTGVINKILGEFAFTTVSAVSHGYYWWVTLSCQDLVNGSDDVTCQIYPAYTSTFSAQANAAVGAIFVGGVQVRDDSWSKVYVKTDAIAIVARVQSNATKYNGLYKISTDGTQYPDWSCNITAANSAYPNPLAIDSAGQIYLTGNITAISGTNVTPDRLYRLKANGSFDREFKGFNGTVRDAKLITDDLLIVAGDFTQYGNTKVGRLIYIDKNGNAQTSGSSVLSGALPKAINPAAKGLIGQATEVARADHEHPSPPIASKTQDGFLSKEDKIKLDALGVHKPVTLCDNVWVSSIPVLTSNSSTQNLAVAASHAASIAWKAFDGDVTSHWDSGVTTEQTWISIQYPSALVVKGYVIQAGSDHAPSNWSVYGATGQANSLIWTLLDSKQNVDKEGWQELTLTGSRYIERNYSFTNTTAYQYYKISFNDKRQVIVKTLKLVTDFSVVTTSLIGQELCVALKIDPAGGLTTSNAGLAVDTSNLTLTSHTHTDSSATDSGLQSAQDKRRFDAVEQGGFDGPVHAILVDGDDYYFAGEFTRFHNVTSPSFIKIKSDFEVDPHFDTDKGFSGPLSFIAINSDKEIFVGDTQKTKLNNQTEKHVWKLTPTGSYDSTFDCPVNIASTGNNTLLGIQTLDTTVILLTPQTLSFLSSSGGTIDTNIGSDAFRSMAKVDKDLFLTSSLITKLADVLNPQGIKKLTYDSSTTKYAANVDFNTAGGVGAAAEVGEVIISPDKTYLIAGNSGISPNWNTAGAANFKGLYKLTIAGERDTDFTADITMAEPGSVTVPFCISKDNFVFIGGPIAKIGSITVTPWGLYKLNAITGALVKEYKSFVDKTGISGKVYDCKLTEEGRLLVGGTFTTYGKKKVNHVIVLNQNGTAHTPCCAVSTGTVPETPVIKDQLGKIIATPDTRTLPAGGSLTITLSVESFSEVSLRYTTDGSVPSASTGTVYSSPIVITAAGTLSVIAYKTGYLNSTGTFTFLAPGTVQYQKTIAGTSLINAIPLKLPQVTFWPSSGLPVSELTLECPGYPDAQIYYANITENNSYVEYDPLLKISFFNTARTYWAKATKTGFTASEISSATYTATDLININFGNPVTSDKKTGAAVVGAGNDSWVHVKYDATDPAVLTWANNTKTTAEVQFIEPEIVLPTPEDYILFQNSTNNTKISSDNMMKCAVRHIIPGTDTTNFNRSQLRYQIKDMPGGVFNIYVYAHGPEEKDRCGVTLRVLDKSSNLVSHYERGTSDVAFTPNWVTAQGEDKGIYVLFEGTQVSKGETLDIQIKGEKGEPTPAYEGEGVVENNGTAAYLNGIQLHRTSLEKTKKPKIEPIGDNKIFPFNVTITLADSTDPTAKIFYTVDDTEPTISSTEYLSVDGFEVTAPLNGAKRVVKAIAVVEGLASSDTAIAVYIQQAVEEVSFITIAGTYPFLDSTSITKKPAQLKIEVNRQEGTSIKYTTDGSNPSVTNGTDYDPDVGILLDESADGLQAETQTIKVFAWIAGNTVDGKQGTAAYTQATCASVTQYTCGSNEGLAKIDLNLVSNTTGAHIWYNVNQDQEDAPTGCSLPNDRDDLSDKTAPIGKCVGLDDLINIYYNPDGENFVALPDTGLVLKAIACLYGYKPSSVITSKLNGAGIDNVEFAPDDTTKLTDDLEITLSVSDEMDDSIEIYYTKNGKSPYEAGVLTYDSVTKFKLMLTDAGDKGKVTIKAFAKDKNGNLGDSCISEITYQGNTVENVTFSENSGSLSCPTSVKLNTGTPNAKIHYKINKSPETVFDGSEVNINIGANTTVTAFASKQGYVESDETSASYSCGESVAFRCIGVSATQDLVGAWDNFSPGDSTPPYVRNNNRLDLEFEVLVNYPEDQTITRLTIFGSDAAGVWSNSHVSTSRELELLKGVFKTGGTGSEKYKEPNGVEGNFPTWNLSRDPGYPALIMINDNQHNTRYLDNLKLHLTATDMKNCKGIKFSVWWQRYAMDMTHFTLFLQFKNNIDGDRLVIKTIPNPTLLNGVPQERFITDCNNAALSASFFSTDFQTKSISTGDSPKSGAAATGLLTGDYWNGLTQQNNYNKLLKYSNKSTSNTTLTLLSGSIDGGGVNSSSRWLKDVMVNNFLYSNAKFQFVVKELMPDSYTVYIYGHGADDSDGSSFKVSIDSKVIGEKATSTTSDWSDSTLGLTENVHYVKFSQVVIKKGNNLIITVNPVKTKGKAYISGIQIMRNSYDA